MNQLIQEKKLAAIEAVKEVDDGMIVGLGTGSTAFFAIEAVAELIKNGMNIQAVPTSEHTRQLSMDMGIPLIDINQVKAIDVTIDGADEFTKRLELIKGGGGALLREKIVASITKNQIIIADSSKYVEELGKFKLPIEVIPFAISYVTHEVEKLGGKSVLRKIDGIVYLTDQKNYILDVDFGWIDDPASLATSLNTIVGIVEHGLFINLANKVFMGKGENVVVFM